MPLGAVPGNPPVLTSILALFVAACAVGPVERLFGRARYLALVPFGAFIWYLLQAAAGLASDVENYGSWFPLLGGELRLRLDGFGALMALLITGIGAGIVWYADAYLAHDRMRCRLLATLFVFMGAMLGIVVSDNLILLFVFWELTSISSYLLIGHQHEDAESRKKALQALLVTGGGGLALLAGFVLLGTTAGTFRISELVAAREVVASSPLLPLILTLVLIGAFTKSAQTPFHFWLPNAMAAPTPVSAYLHSATMVKAGVFLLARLHPLFLGLPAWHNTLVLVGGATLVTGAFLGWVQTDLKRVLAFTTLGVLGMLTLLLGVGSPVAIKTFVVVLLGHAMYKAALFMVAGIIDHETSTREVTRLGGLRQSMPMTAVAAGLAAASSAGLPPFFGFLGKEFSYKTGFEGEWLGMVILPVLVGANAVFFALSLKAGWLPFWSRRPPGAATATHEAPWSLWLPPLLLGVAGLLTGVFSQATAARFVSPAVNALTGGVAPVDLGLWHGVGGPLVLSFLTVGIGIVIYRLRERVWPLRPRIEGLPGPLRGYEWVLDRTIRFSKLQTRSIMNGSLRFYVGVSLLVTVLLVGAVWWTVPDSRGIASVEEFEPISSVACLVVIAGAVFATSSTNRIVALLGLGAVGGGIAILFLVFGAPDLAVTQLLVEALVVILLVLAVFRLPPMARAARTVRGSWLLVGCVLFGAMMGALAYQASSHVPADPISDTLEAWSYPLAHGRNVVNVILVDFRALDTLGEISVLAIAAMGVVALLRKKGGERET
ncbi:MAG: hydrogen gas-evolving membrane-bound hydrogenase subunit E [Opitutaceae bacterium]|nr:hydrogen gas-evolving membrane-bound hydrogenase subunit E [Opitutaceae bacterium]